MVRKRLKYAQRYQEILYALFKNGLGFIVKDLGFLDFISSKGKVKDESILVSTSIGERIRLTLEELGPSFVKLGQLASTRVDLIPRGIIAELEKLQDHVAPVPVQEVKQIIHNELGQPVEQLFTTFMDEPVASASIGQVHMATLKTGQKVAMKIQRPNIEETINIDLTILADLGQLMETKFDWAKNYKFTEIINELSKALKKELDYTIEAWNCEKIARQLKNHEELYVPAIFWDYTTKRVLTMEFVHGTGIREYARTATTVEKKRIARLLVDGMFHQVFIHGFFHGDPHPGNLIILPDKKLAFIDFGMCGHLSSRLKNHLASIIIAIKSRDIDEIVHLLLRVGGNLELIDNEQLYADVDELIELYLTLPMQQISLADLLQNLMEISFRYQIQTPADLTILGKTLLTMEGIISNLDKDLAIIQMAEPFGKKLIRERLKPTSIFKETRGKIRELQFLLSQLSKAGQTVAKDGKIRVEISIPELEMINKKIDRVSNLLSFSIILLAFSIMMVGLVVGAAISRTETFLWNFPVVEVGGIVATLMFLWLLFSILRSGKF